MSFLGRFGAVVICSMLPLIKKYFRTAISVITGKKSLLCLAVIIHVAGVWGKDGTGLYNFQYYGTKDGLPQLDIMSLFQDNKGYIWFGTQSGAARYNGRSTDLFATEKGMAHNSILDIQQDKDGVIYFATPGGVSFLVDDSLHTIFHDTLFNFIFIDRSDRKWFCGEKAFELITPEGKAIDAGNVSGGSFRNIYSMAQHPDSSSVYLATDKGLFYLSEDLKCVEILSSQDIYYIFIDKDGYMWMNMGDDLYRMDMKRLTSEMKLKKEERYPYLKHRIKKIIQSADGDIWGFTSGFAFQIRSFDRPPDTYNRKNGLAGYTLYSLLCDYENNIWVGMVGGVQRLSNKSVKKIAPLQYNGYISRTFEDKKGRIWFSSESSACYIEHHEVVPFSEKTFPASVEYQSICIAEMPDGNILIVHPLYLSLIDVNTVKPLYTRKFEKPVEYAECVFVSSKNEIFISDSYNGILYYMPSYDSPLQSFDTDVASGVFMFSEYQGRVVAANHSGLCVFNGREFEQELSLDHSVWGLYVSGDSLWIGTENGLGLYRNGEVYFLLQGTVNSICRGYDSNHLWLGRNDGAYHLNIKTGQLELGITKETGIPHNEVSVGALMLDSDDLLWIGTYQGLANFNAYELPRYFTKPVNDLAIKQNGYVVEQLDPARLPAFDHSIQFEMTTLSFTYEPDNIYEYSLKGNTKDSLTITGKDFTAHYSNLPPGNYTFVFRSKGGSNIWSDYTSIDFTISKPFWMNWWFYILSLLAAGILSAFAIRRYIHALKQKNKALETAVAERTSLIQQKNDEISHQNLMLKEIREEIEAQNEELAAQNRELFETFSALQQVNDDLEKYKTNLETMVEQKTAELVQAKEKAEESDKLKSAFLANMSHEIRTPLNGIIGFLNIITQNELPANKMKEYLNIIDGNGQRLLKLINDILDISKLEVGQLQIVKSESSVNAMMEELNIFYNEAILQNPKKKLALIFDDSEAIPNFTACIDPLRIRQVLSNLIDNAIKFTEYGYIKYGYRPEGNKILFYVEDTGTGLNEKQVEVIFDRFRQANDDISAKYGGTGLGLAISKNLVTLMNGEMWVISEPGEGSTFFFTVEY
jgi:signal transduction histidine kinase/ligand-binding sensor domain-containing protein